MTDNQRRRPQRLRYLTCRKCGHARENQRCYYVKDNRFICGCNCNFGGDERDELRAALVECLLPYEALLADADSRKWIAPEIWTVIEQAVARSRMVIYPDEG